MLILTTKVDKRKLILAAAAVIAATWPPRPGLAQCFMALRTARRTAAGS